MYTAHETCGFLQLQLKSLQTPAKIGTEQHTLSTTQLNQFLPVCKQCTACPQDSIL